jgi:hypothetical protein
LLFIIALTIALIMKKRKGKNSQKDAVPLTTIKEDNADILTDIVVQEKIGSGNFGGFSKIANQLKLLVVFLGTWQKTTKIALKQVDIQNQTDLINEIKVLKYEVHR